MTITLSTASRADLQPLAVDLDAASTAVVRLFLEYEGVFFEPGPVLPTGCGDVACPGWALMEDHDGVRLESCDACRSLSSDSADDSLIHRMLANRYGLDLDEVSGDEWPETEAAAAIWSEFRRLVGLVRARRLGLTVAPSVPLENIVAILTCYLEEQAGNPRTGAEPNQ